MLRNAHNYKSYFKKKNIQNEVIVLLFSNSLEKFQFAFYLPDYFILLILYALSQKRPIHGNSYMSQVKKLKYEIK